MVEVARLPRIRGGLCALLAQSPSELRGEQLYSYIAFYLFLLFYVLFIFLRRALVPMPPQPQQKTAVWRFLLWSKWRDCRGFAAGFARFSRNRLANCAASSFTHILLFIFFYYFTFYLFSSAALSSQCHLNRNKKPPFGGFCCGRSGETRTRGLMVPNHARYQLRYTSLFAARKSMSFAALGAENGNRTRNLQLGKLLLYH